MLDEIKDEVVLYSLPPSWSFLPMAGLTCIAEYLKKNKTNVSVKYLNVVFERQLNVFKVGQSEQEILSFFTLILEMLESKSGSKLDRIIKFVESSFPKLLLIENECSQSILEDLINETISIIDKSLSENKKVLLHGFSSKFNQWISASVVAKRIKQLYPEAKTVIGGWTNKKAAIDFLQTNNYFDYAIWGEGEITTLKLVNILKSGDIALVENIPGLIYKEDGLIKENIGTPEYVNKEDLQGFDYVDYFKYLKLTNYNPSKIYVPIEKSRGCHWNKCEFCYLNQGYSFRSKTYHQVITELKYFLSKYDTENYNISFAFMDNDIVGNDMKQFEKFLDCLINLKKEYSTFEIGSAEVVTNDFNSSIIAKMKDAGLKNIQIGLEAISPGLLRKINKKQSFSDNLYFMIEALCKSIEVTGANIIYNTLDETEEDIIQSIDNLHFLRFLIGKVEFNLIPLGVANHSRYLRRLQKINKESEWAFNPLAFISNIKYTELIDRYSLFDYTSSTKRSPLWDVFERNLNFYRQNNFKYKFSYNKKTGNLVYREYFGRKKIKDIEFDNFLYEKVIILSSYKVVTLSELTCELRENNNRVKSILSDLKTEGLLYYDDDFSGITSIVRI